MYGRTWSQWFRMHWVIGVSVTISDSDTHVYHFESTRWYLLAFCHMLYLEATHRTEYPYCQINSWMDWKV